MNPYEEDRELEDIPVDEPTTSVPVTFNLPMPRVEQVTAEIARQFVAGAGYSARSDYHQHVLEKIDDLIATKLSVRLDAVINEILAKPMQPRDPFGNPVGEPRTLEGFIAHYVTNYANELVDRDGKTKTKDSYGTQYAPRIDWALGKIVHGELKKQIDDEVSKIVSTLRAGATNLIAKQIAERINGLVLK